MSKYDRLTYYLDEQCTMLVMPQRKDRIEKCIERLSELEDKIESGRMVELPCNVGDTVYQLDNVGDIYESKIKRLIYDAGHIAFDETAIGTSIFTTKEAAEAHLKELQEKQL